jgi:glucose dehydrogenase
MLSTNKSKAQTDWVLRSTGGLFSLTGLTLALPGAYLAMLGGSLYYAAAGLALAVGGVLLWMARMAGAWLFVGVLLATLAWALWESGLDGWALLPRLILFVPLGLLLVVACIRRAEAVVAERRLGRVNARYAGGAAARCGKRRTVCF